VPLRQNAEEKGRGKSCVGRLERMKPRNGTKKNVVYYESIIRELQIKPVYEYRCDERLKTKAEEFTHLGYTGLLGGLEHLKT
jgi:hypothetical protein